MRQRGNRLAFPIEGIASREELETEVFRRKQLGWSTRRISIRFGISWRTASLMIRKMEKINEERRYA